MATRADTTAVRAYLLSLQDRLCAAIEEEDGTARFREDVWERSDGGGGRSRVLSDGAVFEQAGVGFSDVFGSALPPSASVQRPEPRDAPSRRSVSPWSSILAIHTRLRRT